MAMCYDLNGPNFVQFWSVANLGKYFESLRYLEIIRASAFIQGQIVGQSGGYTSLRIKFEVYL